MLRHTSKHFLGLGLDAMRSPVAGVLPRFYHERVVDHYNKPRNVGAFDKNDPTVGTGFSVLRRAAILRSITRLERSLMLASKLSAVVLLIANHLSLPPVKLHCSMLAEDAIKAAVKDYEAKRGTGP
ncbi:NIF system FeS cluster assembly, NifU, N-terminal [Cynara cardunculus var. scolymus]|uniref:NIF system FeS cluster assembly, NifU, N-terminal n=1 Tax=Cynara cardunculus var. scolymus TaxID=59895 RepID=A0A103XWL1_CYNCS|nr:NIF system FeS cluster assembly, NifU, N-terminal [Cynara cardunculus var. scolymus]